MMGSFSLKNAGSMASSVMAAGIQRVGDKVRALSGSTALTKQEINSVLNIPTSDDHITQINHARSGSEGQQQKAGHADNNEMLKVSVFATKSRFRIEKRPQNLVLEGAASNFIKGDWLVLHSLASPHHAEGRVDPKVRERQNDFRFWIPQSM
jgi:hypothetical protein